MSHLLQMRGLKRNVNAYQRYLERVASFTDAWIETISEGVIDKPETVASFTDAWIETFFEVSALIFFVSHLLQMRGLKQNGIGVDIIDFSRIFYRCVD